MAQFYPSRAEIDNDIMIKHPEGELRLLDELEKLPNSFSVYYQPYINFAHPDIIVLHPTGGALIIEVKDWLLSSYTRDRSSKLTPPFFPVNNPKYNTSFESPFQQVKNYKSELYNTLCPELLEEERNIRDKGGNSRKLYGVIKTAVYFANATNAEIINTFDIEALYNSYRGGNCVEFIYFWGKEDIQSISEKIKAFLYESNGYFNSSLYHALGMLFLPSDSWMEQTTAFDLSKLDAKQKELTASEDGQWIRVKGAAGSGKSLIIAQKAINCFKAKQQPVLILTYNITLRNYLRDRIAQNTRDYSQYQRNTAFQIIHWDEFIPQVLKKLGLAVPPRESFGKGEAEWPKWRKALENLIRNNLRYIIDSDAQYSTILIDEGQDFESDWFQLLEDVFLRKDAEFMVVADEKQNVYDRPLDNKLPRIPNFRGRWRQLNRSYRLSNTVYELSTSFLNEFMADKYELDNASIECVSEEQGHYEYHFIEEDSYENRFRTIWNIINTFRTSERCVSPNDICILFESIESIRIFENTIRDMAPHLKVKTMVENQDEYDDILRSYGENKEKAEMELNKVRKVKKFAFNMNSGTIKVCTIHSFKGWEISTVVMILEENSKITDELLYTAITRAKHNLLVMDCGNDKFGPFFKNFSSMGYSVSETPTDYIRSEQFGIGRVLENYNGILTVQYLDGKKAQLNYNYFHKKAGSKQYVCYVNVTNPNSKLLSK